MNPDTENYASFIPELEQWHKLAQKNKDNKQFYNYLYQYLDIISNNRQLYSLIKKHESQEFIGSIANDDKKLQFMRKYVLTARKQCGLTDIQKTLYNEDYLSLIENSRLKETQINYWCYILFNSFYNIYRHDFSTTEVTKISKIEPESVESLVKQKKVKLSKNQSIYKISNVKDEEKSKLEHSNYSIDNQLEKLILINKKPSNDESFVKDASYTI